MAERYRVRLTLAALADLEAIADHHAQVRGLDEAEALIGRLQRHVAGLADFPLRGPVPEELGRSDRTDIRQTMLGRHRIFYLVDGAEVSIFLIADGRRDIDALLEARSPTRDPPR